MLEKLPKAVIFDLDGTLLDTLDGLAVRMNGVLSGAGYPELPRERVRALIGGGAREFMRRSLPESANVSPSEFERLMDNYHAVREEESDLVKVFAGIPQVLGWLRLRGIPLAVLSNKPDEPTNKLVQKFFPEIGFADVRGHVEGFPHKPDPAVLLQMLSGMGAEAADALFVGDGDADCAVSANAGTMFAAALWGYRSRAELSAAGAQDFYDSPAALLFALQSFAEKEA